MAAVTHASAHAVGRLETLVTTDRKLLRAFLEQDRLFAAYALCDLDEREFSKTRWGVALDAAGTARAVAMEYHGAAPQPMFVMGEPEAIEAVLCDVVRPRTAYIAYLDAAADAVDAVYRVQPGPAMVRMWVDRSTFRPAPGASARVLPAEISDLNRLYDLGFTSWLPSEAIAAGVYYGIRVGGRLVAAAGTHVISQEAGLAVVGNVMTHGAFRGRGFAKLTTAAVTQELLRTCEQVVLNVRADNPPALAAYRAIGYQEHVRFQERLAHRRGGAWDSILSPFRRWLPQRKET